MMKKEKDLQELALSYINGNISYVRNIVNKENCMAGLCDELFDILSERDYKLFLKRMKI